MPIYHVKTNNVADGTDTNVVRPSDWNSAHAYTLVDGFDLIGNTTGQGGDPVISSGTLYLAGGNNITLSQNQNSVTISQFPGYESSYENLQGGQLTTMTLNGASISHAAAFWLQRPCSFSFLRIPVRMTAQSTTLASVNTSFSGSACVYSTWNAVIYQYNTGGSSKSLSSVASGSGGFTFMNSASVAANGSQGSFTQAFSAQVEGGGTTLTTQYSASSTAYPFSTTAFSAFTGPRFIDIPFNNSVDAGVFWLVIGYSSSSATNATALNGAQNCWVKYSNHYGASQINSAFGVMGSTNLTSGGLMGCGSFSTAGGGTTSGFHVSAISSSASHVRLYFQALRSG